MTLEHLDGLWEAGSDPSIFGLSPKPVSSREAMQHYIQAALKGRDAGEMLPFVTVSAETGQVIGSTRYGNIVLEHRRLEIGWTWLAPRWQRTRANTEAKLLLLSHAFETLGYRRVEFKTDALNERSRGALLRIGARQEGVFRNHMIVEGGRSRDSVYFSIVDGEWAGVKEALLAKLAAR